MGRSIDPTVWDRWRDRLGRFESSDLTVAARLAFISGVRSLAVPLAASELLPDNVTAWQQRSRLLCELSRRRWHRLSW